MKQTMKYTFTIEAESREELNEQLRDILNSSKMHSALWDLGEYLRRIYKHQEKPDDIETIRKTFFEIIEENDLNYLQVP